MKTPARCALLVPVVVGWMSTTAAAQPQPRTPPPSRPAAEAPAPPWDVQFNVSGVVDSNIDHDLDDRDAIGGLLSGRLRYRTGPLSLEYRLGVNRFNEPTRWNRTTNRAAARLTHALDAAWTADVLGEISFQQRSEDQELGNFYVVAPALVYATKSGRQFRGFLLYRLKQIKEDVDDNATNWYFGGEVEQEAGDGTWIIEYRRELNLANDPRRTYRGHRFTVEHRRHLTRADELRLSFAYRPQAYQERLVNTAEGPEPRMDHRWTPEVVWLRDLGRGLLSRLDYSWERRRSNEIARAFSAHRFTAALVWAAAF